MQPTLNPALRPFWETNTLPDGQAVKYRVLHGGRMSSKSHDMAGMAIARANFRQERFLCLRMYQNRIADSVYTLLKDKIAHFGLEDNFKVYADAIEQKKNGSIFRFYGAQRNIEEVKSFEGATVCWFEESHNLTEEMFITVRPTIMRNDGAEMWFSFNPRLVSDYSYQRLVVSPPKGTLIEQINYDRNEFLTQSALDDINAEFEEDADLAGHIYLGIPLTDDESAVIKRSWLEAAVDADIKLELDLYGARSVGYDVADSGEDKNATAVFNGAVCVDIDEWKAPEDELNQSTKRAWAKVAGGRLIYDSIGVGAHVGSTLKEMDVKTGYCKFNAAGAIINKNNEYAPGIKSGDKFENLKAQAWQDVADRLRNTYNAVMKGMEYSPSDLIAIRSDLPHLHRLLAELASPRKRYSKRGLDMIESKDDMKKRELSSPNLADSFIMGACPHLVVTSTANVKVGFAS